MEVLVDKYGRRVFINSPACDQHYRNLILYDPNNSSNSNLGLYDRTQQPCQRFEDMMWAHEKQYHSPPAYIIENNGQTVYPHRPKGTIAGRNYIANKR